MSVGPIWSCHILAQVLQVSEELLVCISSNFSPERATIYLSLENSVTYVSLGQDIYWFALPHGWSLLHLILAF